MFGRVAVAVLAVFAWFCLVVPAPVAAQERDVAAAAAAFQQAQQAQLRGDYARAAELFELAFSAAESQPALRSAIRNHLAAGDLARAATLSLRALTRYPGEVETRQLAQETLDAQQAAFGHLRVSCSAPCVLILDGSVEDPEASEGHELFLAPGEHHVTADFEGQRVDEQTIVAEAGQETPLTFEAPPPEPAQVEPAETHPEPPTVDAPHIEPPPPPARGVSPAFFWTGAGLTLALGGVTIWSLVDTLHARDDYVTTPTEAGYNAGRKKEKRLYAFTGVLATVGVATLLTGILGTRWSDGERQTARFDLQLGPDGGNLSLTGSF